MNNQHAPFSFGIEEEYLLVDLETRDIAPEAPRALLAGCEQRLGRHFSREYISAQIEFGTPVCTTSSEARRHLHRARRIIATVAADCGLAPIAASTHPFARWRQQNHTDAPRYKALADDLQGLGRRMIINGLHIHVGIESNAERIRLMNELRPFLPILLALSTSSPFWQGEATGLKSYRTAINDATPRKGIPEAFDSWRDYQQTIAVLCKAGVIEDATKIWWDLRPSARFPTLEMRITDVCPLVEDGLCIAALFRCLCRYLTRVSQVGNSGLSRRKGTSRVPLVLINENRWRAQRYGVDRGLIDPQAGRVASFGEVLDNLLELISDDAAFFNCIDEVEHARVILRRGTSADRQLAKYAQLREQGQPPAAALIGVVDLLIAETAITRKASRGVCITRHWPTVPATTQQV